MTNVTKLTVKAPLEKQIEDAPATADGSTATVDEGGPRIHVNSRCFVLPKAETLLAMHLERRFKMVANVRRYIDMEIEGLRAGWLVPMSASPEDAVKILVDRRVRLKELAEQAGCWNWRDFARQS